MSVRSCTHVFRKRWVYTSELIYTRTVILILLPQSLCLPCFGLSHKLVVEYKTWLLDEPLQGKGISCVPTLNKCSVHGLRQETVRSTSSAHVQFECWVAPAGLYLLLGRTICQHSRSFWNKSCRLLTPVAKNTMITRGELDLNRQS